MTYLLAKYAVLLLLSAFVGFLLGRWWLRRAFVDVTESYETISKAASTAPWKQLWERLDAADARVREIVSEELRRLPKPTSPAVELEPLRKGIDDFAARLRAIPLEQAVRGPDLAPTHARIERLEALIKALPRPPAAADLGPLALRLEHLEGLIETLPQPVVPAPVDLTQTHARLESLEDLIRNLPRPQLPQPPDLSPIETRIAHLETLIEHRSPSVPPVAVNLQPLEHRLDAVEHALRAIEIPAAPDLGLVTDRLRIIESSITKLSQEQQRPEPGPRLLRSPTQGTPDDLKRISGVGPKLERLLNDNGVFYFWQIAEWSAEDVELMDARLDVFKGRITRDGWVAQASALARGALAERESRPTSIHADAPI